MVARGRWARDVRMADGADRGWIGAGRWGRREARSGARSRGCRSESPGTSDRQSTGLQRGSHAIGAIACGSYQCHLRDALQKVSHEA